MCALSECVNERNGHPIEYGPHKPRQQETGKTVIQIKLHATGARVAIFQGLKTPSAMQIRKWTAHQMKVNLLPETFGIARNKTLTQPAQANAHFRHLAVGQGLEYAGKIAPRQKLRIRRHCTDQLEHFGRTIWH